MSDPQQQHQDDQAVADVLAELRALRLRLSTDLSAASGALDTGDPAVASDILAGDQADLADFVATAQDRLAAATPETDGVAVPRQRRSRWRRALPVVPVVTALAASAAAAAIVAPRLGDHPADQGPRRTVQAARHPAQVTPVGLQHLRSAVLGHASGRDVLAAADRWHRHLAVLIATSRRDPRRLATVIAWLQQEQRLLRSHPVPDAEKVLAAATRLERHLLQAAAPLLSSLPLPTQSLLPGVLPASDTTGPGHQPTSTPTRAITRPGTSAPVAPTSPASRDTTAPAPTHPPASTPPAHPTWTPPWSPSPSGQSLLGN